MSARAGLIAKTSDRIRPALAHEKLLWDDLRPAGGAEGRATIVRCMTKWEYVTVPLLTHATKQILDNWGDEGYELVAVVPGPNAEQLVAYMKRPKS